MLWGCQHAQFARSSFQHWQHRTKYQRLMKSTPYTTQYLSRARKWCRQQGPWPSTLLLFCALSSDSQPSPQRASADASGQLADHKSKPSWSRIFSLKTHSSSPVDKGSKEPQTIADVTDIVAANVPVFFFHNQEKYFPCTVEWFLEHSRLVKVAKGWRRRMLEVLVDFGMLDSTTLAAEQKHFDAEEAHSADRKRRFLQLQLQNSARSGQSEPLDKIPVYAHVKQTLDPIMGKRDGIEINYMKFLAYNGPYKLFHSIWVGPLGAHDADWEHVTVRLTPDGQEVVGVYYSAHRHRDGAWRSADEVPLSADGRPHAYIAENGHGSYPVAGTILRLFLIINDYTSADGRIWNPEKVVLVSQSEGDKLPSVVSRGNSLNGSTYPSPLSNTGRKLHAKIFFPLLPGVESIWEPALEEIEEALEKLQDGMDEGMEAFKDAAEDVQQEFNRSRKLAYKRWRELMKSLEKGSDR